MGVVVMAKHFVMDLEQQLEQAVREREQFITRIFWLGFEILLIFGIPLALAIFIGLRISKTAVWIALPIAFVFSIIVFVVRYRAISKKMHALDARIKDLRQQVNAEKEDTEK